MNASNLVARVTKIPGVEDVAAMLHVVADDPDDSDPDDESSSRDEQPARARRSRKPSVSLP